MASENKSKVSILTNGIIKENPVLRLVLGTCSCLAVTTAVSSALGMGAAFTFVLVCSNILISLLRNVIPAKVHLPCYIVIIAGFVTIVQMVMHAYMDSHLLRCCRSRRSRRAAARLPWSPRPRSHRHPQRCSR